MGRRDKCQGCGKCCMAFEIGPLLDEEVKSGKYKVYEDHLFPGDFHIKKHMPDWAPEWAKMGVCIYLDEDMSCTIYDDRPDLCRDFRCRVGGKLTSRYLEVRRTVSQPERWTEYERKRFGHFLKGDDRLLKTG